MDQTSNNPLQKHFRQPALYIKLTSNGKFWKDGALELSVTGDLPVYPMTAKDEIMLRTPDALINGTSVVNVIQSCCPNIKDAWQMPSVDVDSTLISIRIASYGQEMTITAKCPKCKEEHDYDVDLQKILSQIRMPDYSQSITTDDGLIIKFKPLTYLQVSKSGGVSFEEGKLIQALADPSLDEEVRKAEYEKHIGKMIELNNTNVTNCTASITVDGDEVTDPKFISEYYQNAESTVLRKVQEKIKEFADVVGIKPVDTLCSACQTQFKLNVEFDYSHFFAKGF
jgi:hypothetical protein